MKLPGRVRALAAVLLEGIELEHRVRLEIDGCVIDVVSDDAELSQWMSHYFVDLTEDLGAMGTPSPPDFRVVAVQAGTLELDAPWTVKPPDPGKKGVKEEWVDLPDGRVVRKRRTGMIFAFGGDLHLAYGPCRRYRNQIVNFVNNRYMQWRLTQGFVLAHAGAVGYAGRCLALCGPSGAGKSTAALDLVGRGLDFVSNDRLLLRDREVGGVECYGVPKHPRVNPGTIIHNPLLQGMIEADEKARLEALSPEELKEVEDKYDVLIHRMVGPGRFRMHGILDGLVILNWTGTGPARIGPVDLDGRRDLIPLVAKSPGLFYEPEDDDTLDLSDDRYVDVFSRAPIFEITGRQDFDAVPELCLGIFEAWDGAAGPAQ